MPAISLFSPAQNLGYVALIFGVAAFLQKQDYRLKALSAIESIVYVAHFFLLGNYPASGSALVSTLRNLTALRSRSPWWIAFFMILILGVGASFTKSMAGWLPVVASGLATVAIFRLNGIAMRLALLVCTLLWFVNNILSGSIGGTVLEAIIAITNMTTIYRLVTEQMRGHHAKHILDTAPQTIPVQP